MNMLAMGDYGAYVWSSFSLTLIVVVVMIVQARRRHENIFNEIRTRLKAMESDQ